MADLGDFFKKKNQKKPKPTSNLNVASAETKVEDKKTKKAQDDPEWKDEDVIAPSMANVAGTLGNMSRDDDKQDQDDSNAPAWGQLKNKASAVQDHNSKKFPTLAKAVKHPMSAHLDEDKQAIKTTRNKFAELDDTDDTATVSKSGGGTRVQKKQGETQKEAEKRAAREKKNAQKLKKKDASDDDDNDSQEASDASDDEAQCVAVEQPKESRKKKEKKVEKVKEDEPEEKEEEEDLPEDTKILPDDDEVFFTIEVDKSSDDAKLGISWIETDSGLEILAIKDEGLVAERNEKYTEPEVNITKADEKECNGDYTTDGSANGRAKYKNEHGAIIFFSEGKWKVNIEDDMDDFIYSIDHAGAYPQSDEWKKSGAAGACTVELIAAVQVHDRIVSVNEYDDPDDMRSQLKQHHKLEIDIKRPSAVKSKYKGRSRLQPVKLPESERREKERAKGNAPVAGKSKKNKFAVIEEDTKKKHLQSLPDDFA